MVPDDTADRGGNTSRSLGFRIVLRKGRFLNLILKTEQDYTRVLFEIH